MPIRQISPVCADANPSGATAPPRPGVLSCSGSTKARLSRSCRAMLPAANRERPRGKETGNTWRRLRTAQSGASATRVPRPTKGPARASSRQHAEVECTALVAKTRCQDRRRGSISAYGAANSGDRTGTGGLKAGMQRPVPPAAKTCANWHEPCSSGGWYQTPTAG